MNFSFSDVLNFIYSFCKENIDLNIAICLGLAMLCIVVKWLTDGEKHNVKTTMATFAFATPLTIIAVKKINFTEITLAAFYFMGVILFIAWSLAYILETNIENDGKLAKMKTCLGTGAAWDFVFIILACFSAKVDHLF